MGLDTSHNCWHGAYSAFSRWRDELARAAGYRFAEPTAEDRAKGWFGGPYVDIDWTVFTAENYQGEWDTVPGDDPLIYLLAHSDCDGAIHPEQGIHLAQRLESLLPLLDESKNGGHITSMRGKTQQFIDGLREAAQAGEDVEFA